MKNVSQIQQVAWDFGDTLVKFRNYKFIEGAKIASIEAKYLISPNQLRDAIKQEWNARKDPNSLQKILETNSDSKEVDYWVQDFYPCVLNRVAPHARFSKKTLEWFSDLQTNPENFELLPHAKSTLESLRYLGIEQGVLSNAFPSAKKIISYLRLSKYFSFTILSYEVKLSKPDNNIYELLVSSYKQKSDSDILYIDDRIAFLQINKNLNIKPIWLNENFNSVDQAKMNDLNKQKDYYRTITRIENLNKVLDYFYYTPDEIEKPFYFEQLPLLV